MNNENDIFASFTFGKDIHQTYSPKDNIRQKISENNLVNNNISKLNPLLKKRNTKKKNINTDIIDNSKYFQNYSAQNYNIIEGSLNELTFGANKNIVTNPKESNNLNTFIKGEKNNYSILKNPEGMNDSYIFVIIYAIHHMKLFRQYIINNLNKQMQSNRNISLLYNLREILFQFNKNRFINISNFVSILSDLFQTHRKFLLDQPDDPSDLLFVLINSIHSYSLKFPLNEVSDENCLEKCFSHKFIWLDLSRIDKCKCNGSTKRLFSNHNYITDIPVNKIFNLIKIKNNISLYDTNKKLFEYYTNLVSRIKTNCPINGLRCPINKTFHKLHLSNSPSYLIFNLEQNFNEYNSNYAFSDLNILKNFVLIPNKFDIWNLFELNSKKNKNNFDLIGFVLFRITKVYSCAFKNKKGLFVYYDYNWKNNIYKEKCDMNTINKDIIEFVSYFDLVFFCIKNGLVPVMLFYQGSFLTKKNKNNNMNNYDDFLSKEQIDLLEKYCINTDYLNNILQNNIRKKDNLLISKNPKNVNSNSNKKNDLIQNKNNQIINEYSCPNCDYKNKITDKICIKCFNNNKDYLSKKIISSKNIQNNLLIKKEIQSKKLSQIFGNKLKPFRLLNTKFQKSQDNIKINRDNINNKLNNRKKFSISPDIKHLEANKFLEKYNIETYHEKGSNNLLKGFISFLKMNNSHKNIEKNIFLNKTELNDNNIFNLNKNDIIKSIHKSPKIKKTKLIHKNLNNYNMQKHKKVKSSNEKFDFFSTDNSKNKIYTDINYRSHYKNSKTFNLSRTIDDKEKKDFNKINDIKIKKRKNFNFKKEYDKINDKLKKSNKNIPVYTMHYSYNDIYLDKKEKNSSEL